MAMKDNRDKKKKKPFGYIPNWLGFIIIAATLLAFALYITGVRDDIEDWLNSPAPKAVVCPAVFIVD